MQDQSLRNALKLSARRSAVGTRRRSNPSDTPIPPAIGDDRHCSPSPTDVPRASEAVDGTIDGPLVKVLTPAASAIGEPEASLDRYDCEVYARTDEDVATPVAYRATPAAARRARSRRNFERIRSAYSLIGGALIGMAVSLPVLALDIGADAGGIVLCMSLFLSFLGFGLHFRASK